MGDGLAAPRGRVAFIGAGPGAPDLITVRGARWLAGADVVIYADSLVDPAICGYARPGAELHGSSSLSLPEIIELMLRAVAEGKRVARVHSGDPSLYGALHEQLVALERAGVDYEIIPGVSSAFAAAAALRAELTVPNIAQTVVMTRVPTRTTVPEAERLRRVAAAGGTLCLFLSATAVETIVEELAAAGWSMETPVAVAYRVTWPEERVLRGRLGELVGLVRGAGLTKQALILIGAAVDPAIRSRAAGERSHLYHEGYSHAFRTSRLPRAERIRGAKRRRGPRITPASRAETGAATEVDGSVGVSTNQPTGSGPTHPPHTVSDPGSETETGP